MDEWKAESERVGKNDRHEEKRNVQGAGEGKEAGVLIIIEISFLSFISFRSSQHLTFIAFFSSPCHDDVVIHES